MMIPSSISTVPDQSLRYKLLYPVRSKDAKPEDYPKWFPNPSQSTNQPEADAIFEAVVKKLESHLNVTRQTFNIDDLWRETHPDSMDSNLVKATGTIYQKLVYHSMAHNIINPFVEQHRTKRGRAPYLEPILKRRVEYGAQIPETDISKALKDFETFKIWLLNTLFSTSHPSEIPILIFPQSWGIPCYRDESQATPKEIKSGDIFWEGFSVYSISYVSGCPDITVPVGEVKYRSRITETEEWLPVSLSVLSRPGNDGVLMGLLRELEEGGVLRSVRTGSRAFGE